jgi:hypothetical protein
MKLYLLLRKISPYTFPDIVLGCFTSIERANDVRSEYLALYKSGTKIDPWKEQGFKNVNLDEDVQIINLYLPTFYRLVSSVFLVSSYSEGFGQVRREIVDLCLTRISANRKAEKLKLNAKVGFPETFRVEEIQLNQLYQDDNLQEGYWWMP